MPIAENIEILLRLRNAREVAAGLRTTAGAALSLDATTQRLGRSMEQTAKRGFLMNQALFTLRRYGYMATLALTAGATAVVAWGYQYNSQVQQARLAFSMFLGTQKNVNDEISKLYTIAAVTPFLFQDITTATRRFLAFGMTLDQSNRTITAITDSLSAMGIVSASALNRASLALGHMFSLGRLTGQVVYQLARDNIPMIAALKTELGLTGDQLAHVATLGISASTAINALDKYVASSRMAGAGRRFGLSTVQGILSTLRDYTAKFMGELETRQFNFLQRMGTRMLNFMQGAGTRGFRQGGLAGFFGAIDPHLGGMISMLLGDFSALARIFKTALIPAIMTVVHYLGPAFYAEVYLLSHIIQFLSQHTLLLRIAFTFLAAALAIQFIRWIALLALRVPIMLFYDMQKAYETIMIALGLKRIVVIEEETAATEGATVATKSYQLVTTSWGLAVKSAVMWTLRSTAALLKNAAVMIGSGLKAIGGYVAALWGKVFATEASTAAEYQQTVATFTTMAALGLAGAAIWGYIGNLYAMAAAQLSVALEMAADWLIAFWPVGLAVLAIAAVSLATYELYNHWQQVVGYIKAGGMWVWNFFRRWGSLGLAIVAPFAVAAFEIYKHFDDIKGWLQGVYNFFIGIFRRMERFAGNILSAIWNKIPGHRLLAGVLGGASRLAGGLLQGLATGGYVTSGGAFLVGERGPEIATLPRGSAVTAVNTNGLPPIDLSRSVIELTINQPIYLDGKKIANNTSKHRLDVKARR